MNFCMNKVAPRILTGWKSINVQHISHDHRHTKGNHRGFDEARSRVRKHPGLSEVASLLDED